ncbi:MAG: glycine zipper 2TM domain-containing protein [Patescibacteria group bacterium]|nr:glycine zipper 2TM domain-containing protein [Patescibacteria group bacterium]
MSWQIEIKGKKFNRRRKMKKMIRLFLVGLVVMVMVAGCAYSPQNRRLQQGAGIGAVAGGVAGRLLGHDQAGMWLGATIGTALGATIGTIMDNEREAIIVASQQNRRVVVYDNQGGAVEAIPGPVNQRTNCRKVTTRQWKGGQLLSEEINEVCTGRKTTDTY